MRNIATFTLVIAVSLCVQAQSKNDISGLYGECEPGYSACEQMYLDPSGKFEYYVSYDVGGGGVIKGIWEFSNDTLYLNSNRKPKQAKILIKNSFKTHFDSLSIHVYDFDSTECGFANLVIDEKYEVTTDIYGFARIHALTVDSLRISYLSETLKICLKGLDSDDISVFIPNQCSLIPEYLYNEKWIIKNGNMIPFLSCKKLYDIKYLLKKTRMENKRF